MSSIERKSLKRQMAEAISQGNEKVAKELQDKISKAEEGKVSDRSKAETIAKAPANVLRLAKLLQTSADAENFLSRLGRIRITTLQDAMDDVSDESKLKLAEEVTKLYDEVNDIAEPLLKLQKQDKK